MATKVIMPKLSPTMEEGQLSRWLKKEGDKVSMGEPLAEIDTDKATMEMQALGTGVLRKILIQEGESAPLGQLIAIIGEPDEDISSLTTQAATTQETKTPAPAATEATKPEASPAAVPEGDRKAVADVSGNGGGVPQPVEAASSGRLIVSPLAARMAAEAGLDLRSVSRRG
jgi:pyruvate dehydrogenase E2 component (dihydrolipoamide acetyltransferase)